MNSKKFTYFSLKVNICIYTERKWTAINGTIEICQLLNPKNRASDLIKQFAHPIFESFNRALTCPISGRYEIKNCTVGNVIIPIIYSNLFNVQGTVIWKVYGKENQKFKYIGKVTIAFVIKDEKKV